MQTTTMENMTVREALEATVQLLRSIEVPVGYMRRIGVPISDAADNIVECIMALDNPKKKEKEETGKPEEDTDGNADAE